MFFLLDTCNIWYLLCIFIDNGRSISQWRSPRIYPRRPADAAATPATGEPADPSFTNKQTRSRGQQPQWISLIQQQEQPPEEWGVILEWKLYFNVTIFNHTTFVILVYLSIKRIGFVQWKLKVCDIIFYHWNVGTFVFFDIFIDNGWSKCPWMGNC